MEKRITKYDLDEATREKLDSAMLQILQICQINRLPMFISVAVKNNEEETEYKSYVYSSTSNYVNLTNDQIRKHMLIANNYEAVPPREIISIDMEDFE